ncbi:folliculin-interacting protein 1-like isoform X2 [Mytilus californianus]|uniref:folliculin-interacting protein 1-like isoform X2 n=1 Tax=Mytilus californianus TaxID=6549 RepID=UPI0022471CAF|nr:folliculin-interacting protein 1-like isoform X2 [Mytilus californianus]
MAQQFLKKLFPISRSSGDKWRTDSKSEWKPPKLERTKIRLVLYHDNERDRNILYDSTSVRKTEELQGCHLRKKGCIQNRLICSDGDLSMNKKHVPSKYMLTRKMGSDVKVLEELMFGSVGMAFKGPSFKVHFLRNPSQMMLTKVFIPENHLIRESLYSDLDSIDSLSIHSNQDLSISDPKQILQHNRHGSYIAQSIPVDVPSMSQKRHSFDLFEEDSGLSLTSSGSFHASFPSPGSNPNSYTSLHRRWMRSQSMSLEGYTMRKRNSQDNLVAQDRQDVTLPARRRRSKIAMGILFELNDNDKNTEQNKMFENFFFSHITLLESHLEKLKLAIEKAHYNRGKFVDIVTEALEIFRDDVIDLYTTPRLSEPVWLNMMSHASYRYPLCENFMKDFMSLVTKHENKNNNFFISTLVTAVLTHHLAWVATVTPAGATTSKTYLHNHSAKWVDALAKSHPYNPMWAQLGDLYGAIGYPLKLARTVIVGKKADLVKKLLYILTYFIRCSDVQENTDLSSMMKCMEDMNLDDSEKQDITPIKEDCNSNCSIPFGNEDACSVCSNDITVSVRTKEAGSKNELRHSFSFDHYDTKNKSIESVESDIPFPITVTGKSVFYVENDDLQLENCLSHNETGNKVDSSQINQNEKRIDRSSYCSDEMKVGSSQSDRTENKRISRSSMLDSLDSVGHQTEDEGYDSILSSGNFEETLLYKPCRLSGSEIKENVAVENVQLVSRAVVDTKKHSDLTLPLISKDWSDSHSEDIISIKSEEENKVISPRKKSLLSETLSNESNKISSQISENNTNRPKLTTAQIRNNFLKVGSNSLFNEYFDDDNIHTKTIDEVDVKDRVLQHPLACGHSKSSGNIADTNKKEDLYGSQSELEFIHATRLNSIGNGVRPRISSFTRQISSDKSHKANRPSSLAPGRCRSVTPTELGRRRHLSSTGSFDIDWSDPIQHLKEIDIPSICDKMSGRSINLFDRNFGRSLLAGYSNHYLSDFVLHGTSESSFNCKMMKDLQLSVQHSVLDETISEAVGIVADTDKWTVEINSSLFPEKSPQPVVASQLVCNLIEDVLQLWKLKMSPEFCLMHLEDRLQEIYFKSKMLAEYLKDITTDGSKKCSVHDLTHVLGFERGDLPLLMAIAGTHSLLPVCL